MKLCASSLNSNCVHMERGCFRETCHYDSLYTCRNQVEAAGCIYPCDLMMNVDGLDLPLDFENQEKKKKTSKWFCLLSFCPLFHFFSLQLKKTACNLMMNADRLNTQSHLPVSNVSFETHLKKTLAVSFLFFLPRFSFSPTERSGVKKNQFAILWAALNTDPLNRIIVPVVSRTKSVYSCTGGSRFIRMWIIWISGEFEVPWKSYF